MQAIFLEDEQRVNAFVKAVSKPRLTKYLQEANSDLRSALRLYHWNAQLSQCLYLPLQTWEIALRNKLDNFFCYKYDEKWPFNGQARRNFNGNDTRKLEESIDRLQRDLGTAPTKDQVVADLSCGFWVSQFSAKYGAQYGWRNNLKFQVFTHDHSIDQVLASDLSNDLLDLRNRVAHHEPIFHLELDLLRDDIDTLVRGLCPSTADYMSSACSFQKIWNAKPLLEPVLGQADLQLESSPKKFAND